MSAAIELIETAGAALEGVATNTGMRQALLRGIFSEIGSLGIPLDPGSVILGALRDNGLGIRTQTFYQIYNAAKDEIVYQPQQEAWPDDEVVPDEIMPYAPFNTRAPYVFQVEMEMEESDYGKGGPKTFYMLSNDPLSKMEVVAEFADRYMANFPEGSAKWDTLVYSKGYRGKLP